MYIKFFQHVLKCPFYILTHRVQITKVEYMGPQNLIHGKIDSVTPRPGSATPYTVRSQGLVG